MDDHSYYENLNDDILVGLKRIISKYSFNPVYALRTLEMLENKFCKIYFALNGSTFGASVKNNDRERWVPIDLLAKHFEPGFELIAFNLPSNHPRRELVQRQIAQYAYIFETYLGDILMGEVTLLDELTKKMERRSKLGGAVRAHFPAGHPLRLRLGGLDWEEEAEAYFKEYNIFIE